MEIRLNFTGFPRFSSLRLYSKITIHKTASTRFGLMEECPDQQQPYRL